MFNVHFDGWTGMFSLHENVNESPFFFFFFFVCRLSSRIRNFILWIFIWWTYFQPSDEHRRGGI